MINHQVIIRKTIPEDYTPLWNIFKEVVEAETYFMHSKHTTRREWKNYWLGKDVNTYTAVKGNMVVGSYILKPNQPGLGSHVANASYIVNKVNRGKGIGELLAEHSISEAKNMDYIAIQFNAVVSTNHNAVKLWKKYGFKIVGTNPEAFRHHSLGLVDTYVMYRTL